MTLPVEIHRCSSFVEVLSFWVKHHPDKEIYRFLNNDGTIESISYQQLYLMASCMAGKIAQIAPQGERVILVYPPGLDLTVALWGCFFAGVIAVPLYPPINKALTHKFIALGENADTSLLMLSDDMNQQWKRLKIMRWLSKIPGIRLALKAKLQHHEALIASPLMSVSTISHKEGVHAEPIPPVKIEGSDIAYLQYTSGSTGTPKGVMVSHRNLVAQTVLNFERVGMDSHSRMVSWLPPYHDLGLVGGMLLPIVGGGNSILMSPIRFLKEPANWLRAISDYEATISGGPPFAYDLVIQKTPKDLLSSLNLSSWKHAFIGAEPIHSSKLSEFEAFIKQMHHKGNILIPGYGLAETTLTTASIAGGEPFKMRYFSHQSMKRGEVIESEIDGADSLMLVSNGKPYEQLIIVNPETKMSLNEKEIGEIWVQGESVTLGYWRNQEKTCEVYGLKLANHPGEWVRTGDLGFLLDGELYITSRIKDLIIINGLNYHPQDIELTVSECHPAIRKGCAAAFMIQLDVSEGLGIAVEVYCNEDLHDIAKHICQEVGIQHDVVVHEIILLKQKALPKTTSGKIARQECIIQHKDNAWQSLYHYRQ